MFFFFPWWNSRSKCKVNSTTSCPSSLLKFGWNPHSQRFSFPESFLFPLWRDWQAVRNAYWPSALWASGFHSRVYLFSQGFCAWVSCMCVCGQKERVLFCGCPCTRKHHCSPWTWAFSQAKPGNKTTSVFFKSTVFWRNCHTNLWLHWEEKTLGGA